MAARSSHTRSSVHIEVIDEQEYAEEVAQEQEHSRQKREEHRQRASAAAAAAAAPSAVASSSSSAVSAPVPSASPWTPLLSSLSLPPLFATLHDLRVYDPPALARAMRGEVPTFQREASKTWKRVAEALEGLASNDAQQAAAIAQLRPILTPLVCACIRFMLPALPPSPTPLVPANLAGDPDVTPPSLAEQAPPFEFVWQTPESSALAARSLQQLARIFQREWEAQTDAIPAPPAAEAVAASGPDAAVSAVMRDSAVQRFLAWMLPTHLLPFLRAEMRSGSASAGSTVAAAAAARENTSGTAEWKSAAHFPSAFFVCFLCAHLAPATLSAHLRSLLPLVLPLVDDHELHLKVAGLAAVQRLVRFVPALHFGEGWGALLLRALKAALAFKEPPVQALAVPTYVQAHMVLFPAVIMQQEERLHQLAPRVETRRGGAAAAVSPSKKATATASSLAASSAPTAQLELTHRVAAQEAMFTTLLQELSYLSLSPTLDHLFATFVYAQTLLPVLLYLPPPIVVRHTSALLPVVLQWCSRFRLSVQRRVARLGWELLECWLALGTPGARLAQQHLGRIVETCAQGWIVEMELEDEMRSKRARAGAALPPRTDRVPSNDPDFHLHYTSQPTIVHVLQLLRGHEPAEFDGVWTELRAVPELHSLVQAVDAPRK